MYVHPELSVCMNSKAEQIINRLNRTGKRVVLFSIALIFALYLLVRSSIYVLDPFPPTR